jgi:hypothetical protein
MISLSGLLDKLWRGYGAKGSLYPQGDDGAEVELAVGPDGQIPYTDATEPSGWRLDDPPTIGSGGLAYQGTWNATTNTPAIPAAGAGNNSWFYIVATAGTTAIDGIAEWAVGDWIISDGIAWRKLDFSNNLLDAGQITTGNLVIERLTNDARDFPIEVAIGDGVNVITTGVKGVLEVQYPCTIQSSRVFAPKESGSITITVKKIAYASYPGSLASIVASAKPTLASAQKSEDTTLTGWTVDLVKGDILEWTVDSAATVTVVIHSLRVRKKT